ncbi:transmembrane protein, putative (DUF 3339) [Tasmannia lanceolata]|uniref:transmembrane protein, putative (DUF 3339) n=1 Tax=Tasmannia lanceolata TaxID=3420 RepID=UPI00406452D0
MKDLAPTIVAVALFVLLSPGLIFQLPGKHRPIDFMNMKTSMASIVVHTLIYGVLLMLFLVILHFHIYAH